MSELAKTTMYVGGALLVTALAYITRPGPIGIDPPDMEGKPLFANFTDPYEATEMQILRYNEGLGQIAKFDVVQKADQWVIPSHSDYPADAEEQLKEAATALVDLKVIGVASELTGDHALYGVVEPDPDKTEVGERGVGTLIAMKDTNGNDLANVVIGKQVKDTEDQRYVRIPGQNPVYTVKIDPEKFSTDFEDWIEKDLLSLSSFDVQQVNLKDYSFDVVPGRGINYDQRLDMTVTWNADDFKWELDDLKEGLEGRLQPVELGEDEELNKETLDGLKDALDELKIADVQRKPEGLRVDLKADADFMRDPQAQESLRNLGYYVVNTSPNPSDEQIEILSSDGEVLARTKEGVEYVLRFGGIAGVATGGKEGEEGEEGSLNRFVFVTTRIHEDGFPEPEYEQVPGEDAEPTQPAPLGQEEEATEGSEPADDASDTDESEDAGPETEASEGADSDQSETTDASDEGAGAEATDAGTDADAETDTGTDTDAETDTETDTDAETDTEKEDVEDERDRIIKENERKRKEYEDKRKKAADKVDELNRRFADWYYVIPDDVYKKIHLGRGDVVKAKEKTEEEEKEAVDTGVNMDSFRQLQEQGLSTEGSTP